MIDEVIHRRIKENFTFGLYVYVCVGMCAIREKIIRKKFHVLKRKGEKQRKDNDDRYVSGIFDFYCWQPDETRSFDFVLCSWLIIHK